VVAIDILPMDPVPGVDFAGLDFLDESAPARLKDMIGGPADVVLSDMAANATGHAKTDHLKIMALVEAAADFARSVLSPGGSFLAKVLQGGTEAELLASLKRDYKTVRHVKPAASRADSAELYLLATGFRGESSQRPRRRGSIHVLPEQCDRDDKRDDAGTRHGQPSGRRRH
jgi:23S rRNA (uridine2552-2'-O)-methyltransferase